MRLREAHALLEIRRKLEASSWPFSLHTSEWDSPEVEVSYDEQDHISGVVEIIDPENDQRCLRCYYLSISPGEEDFQLHVSFDRESDSLINETFTIYSHDKDFERLEGELDDAGADTIKSAILTALVKSEAQEG